MFSNVFKYTFLSFQKSKPTYYYTYDYFTKKKKITFLLTLELIQLFQSPVLQYKIWMKTEMEIFISIIQKSSKKFIVVIVRNLLVYLNFVEGEKCLC